MVSVVIVSHSLAIVQGITELVTQMTQGKVEIAGAGGIDDPENPFGTDPMKILEAITSVYTDDGVIVLIDLGSAQLSAETALEFLEPQQREHVVICPAPLVEGAVAAGVQASIGAALADVLAEALSAYDSKRSQFPNFDQSSLTPSQLTTPSNSADTMLTVTIPNRLGLHARPAARFVTLANRSQSSISLRKVGIDRTVNAKSINQVVTLGARQGDQIEIRASGADAQEVLQAIQALVDDNLGDDDGSATEVTPTTVTEVRPSADTTAALNAVPASPGYAIGPAVTLKHALPQVQRLSIEDPRAEWERLASVIHAVQNDLVQKMKALINRGQGKEAQIFEAHQLILQDPALIESTRGMIDTERINAEAAWRASIQAMADTYRQIEDAYIRERADDVEDIGRQVLMRLTGQEIRTFTVKEPSIVIARTLSPSDTAAFSPDLVLGILTEVGGTTSHSAILARSLGIPAIVGVGSAIQTIQDGQTVAFDGTTGDVWIDPPSNVRTRLNKAVTKWRAERQRLQSLAAQPAVTRDGHRVLVAANIGTERDAQRAAELGAEGVGLFRSELLFIERMTAPTEDEQFEVYRKVAAIMGERPVILRTLDIGGDKPLPYLHLPAEENPFLGWRGIRLTLGSPNLFKTQLRAALRASAESSLSLMFPMVSTLSEVRAAKAVLETAKEELRAEGRPFNAAIQVGIMIEVPAAVIIADHLAREVDFLSIGTNDLTQYLMAADRGNAQVNMLVNALDPAVLRMIKHTIDAAHRATIGAYMCGELASHPLAIPLLVGMGLDELSVGVAAIPEVKARVRDVNRERMAQLVDEVLKQPTAEAVSTTLKTLA